MKGKGGSVKAHRNKKIVQELAKKVNKKIGEFFKYTNPLLFLGIH